MKVTDDDGGIYLLIGLKYTVLVVDTAPPIITTPHSTNLVFCETKAPTQDRGGHKPLSWTRQCILMYLNLFYTAVWVVWIPPKNMFKMFPQTTSPYRTTGTPQKFGQPLKNMIFLPFVHGNPMVCSYLLY